MRRPADIDEKQRGGRRANAGRKAKTPGNPMKGHTMRWTDSQWADALLIGAERVRALVTKEAERVRSKGECAGCRDIKENGVVTCGRDRSKD